MNCVSAAMDFAARTRALRADEVAKLFRLAGGEDIVEDDDRMVVRRFDPARPPAPAGIGIRERAEVSAVCADAFKFRQTLATMSARTAVDIGLSKWMAALNDQGRTARDVRRQIKDAISGHRQTQGRLADLVGRLAPRAGEFRVIRRGARSVPVVVLEVVNPLDRPIQAMLMSMDVRRPDGTILGSGRLTFRPTEPLGPAVESRYTVDLGAIGQFEKLVDVRDQLQVTVRVEDVVTDGVRLLGDHVVDQDDQHRDVALGVFIGRVAEMRETVRRIRERIAG